MELLANFNTPYLDIQTIDTFAKKVNVPAARVKAIFERLNRSGLMSKINNRKEGQSYYSLMPFVPGMFEFYYSAHPENDPIAERPMADLFESYLQGTLVQEVRSGTPWARVLPAVQPVEQLVEVNENIDVEPKILPFEQAKLVLQACRSFAVMPCACRTHGKYLGRDVSKWPMDVCIQLNLWADYIVDRGIGRSIGMEEAFQILKDSEKAGLVHTTTNSFKTTFICNCDPENCLILSGYIRGRYLATVAKSNFLPSINAETCKKCETCMKNCPARALFHHFPHDHELNGNFMAVRDDLCIGCGICAANCEQGVITLKKVRNATIAEGIAEMWQNFKAQKRGLHGI